MDLPSGVADAPATIIYVHPTENPRKCTVRALRERVDFVFHKWPRDPERLRRPDLRGYVRLSLDGPPIGPADRDHGLLVLDATWRHVVPMERAFEDVPTRSLPPLVTAYPRQSKVFDDPGGGLATIEAIYGAFRLMGRSVDGLLDHYHWRSAFLEANGWS